MKKTIIVLAAALFLLVGCNVPKIQPTPLNMVEITSLLTPEPTLTAPTPAFTLEPPMDDVEGDISFTWDSGMRISYTGEDEVEYYIITINGIPRRTELGKIYSTDSEINNLIEEFRIEVFDENDNLLDESILHNLYFYRSDANISEIVSLYPQIERLYISLFLSEGFIDLAEIGKLKNLKHLYINDCNEVNDFNLLGELPYLESLDINRAADLNLSFLKRYPSLKKLKIWAIGYYFHNIDAISELANLEYLDLHGYDGNDVDALSSLNALKYLTLKDYIGTDIEGLLNLTDLEELTISNYQGTSLSSLENLTNLQYLHLCSLKNVEDISSLGNLTNIESLELCELEKVTNIDAIGSLPNLEYLMIGLMPNIQDSTALSNLTNLKQVDIRRGEVNLQPISQAECIEILDIWGGANLGSISNMTNLKVLDMSLYDGCGVDNIDWLADLTKLEKLDINNSSEISDFTSLSKLSNLEFLSVCGQNVDYSFLCKMHNLESLQTILEDDSDFGYIADMNNLLELHITFKCKYPQFPDMKGKLKNLERITIREGDSWELDISPLRDLDSLIGINLPWTEYIVLDLSPIEDMTQLEETCIDFYSCINFPDISNHSSLRELKIIDLDDETFFENVWANENIESLYISESVLNDISQIVNMTSLREVTLFSVAFTDYTPLLEVKTLEKLVLVGPIDEQELIRFYDIEGLEFIIR